jgi:hypothetical protein
MTGGPVFWRSSSTCPERLAAIAVALGVALGAGPARADEPAAPLEVSVRAAAPRRDPGRVTLPIEEARRVPGTGGDALKAVESLPGVGRSAFDGGKLVVWGAAPGDTRVYVDGVEVPALYHGGGLRGVIGADLVQSIDLVPGAYGADHGRGLGGLVRLRTRELPEEGVHGFVGADLLDASAMVSAALGGRLRIALAGRVSYLDRILAGVVSPDVGEFVPIPRYRDYQAKVSLALRQDEAIDLVLLGSGDALDRTVVSADPARVHRETTSSSFHRAYLRYTRSLEDGSSVVVTPFFGQDRDALDASFGAVPARREEVAWRYGARASYRLPLGGAVTASVGLDALGSSSSLSRQGSLNIPPREGDLYVFGQPPGADVNADRWSTSVLDAAPYLLAEVKLGPLTVTPGLRVDAFLIEGSRLTPRVGDTPVVGFSRLTAAIDPRLSMSLALGRRLTFSAAAGVYHQPPAAADLGAVFGTPALSLQRAVHVTAGAAARLADGLSLEVTGFDKLLDHLVVRSRLPSPTLAQALTQDGEGRSYGVQVLLRRQLRDGLLGWLAYTASRSERRYAGDAGYRLFDADQTHVLSLVASYERRGWSGGARFRATTGAPRTPVVGSFYETTSGQFEPLFGAQNSVRLPAFYQLDLRAEKKFTWARAALDVYLDVLNVTFHKNAEELVYSADYSRHSYITGLPILAVLGVRLSI